MDKVLIIAPHPDDESLGAGGTLLSHKKNNDELHLLIMTTAYEDQGFSKNWIEKREEEIETIKDIYGLQNIHKFNFKTKELDKYPQDILIQKIASIIEKVKPEILYLPFHSDIHTDHQITFKAAFACTKQFRYPYIKRVLMYETISETEFALSSPDAVFIPNVFIDITDTFEGKIGALKVYESELGEHPFPRSLKNIKALAIHRGATSGVTYSEAFMLVKEIVKI